MNIHEGLEERFKYISQFNGVCLNIEERFKLEIALNNLHLDIKSDEMWFWGKITGVEKDYYIAVALFFREHYQFPGRKFFFCNSSNFIFSELPEIQDHHINSFLKFNTYFIGNPDIILENFDSYETDDNNYNEEENEEVFKPKLKLKNLTESDRLSFVVRSIDFDCNVVPEGAFKMLPINELRRNDTYSGLNPEDLKSLKKFCHFRKVQNKDKKDLIDMGEAIFNFGFLDSIDQDPIKGN
jgi:radial spoke head protein 9